MALIRGEQISGSVASSSYAVSASYASTASYVLGLATDRITSNTVETIVSSSGNIFLIKSGSSVFHEVDQVGSTTFTSDADTIFLIRNFGGNPILTVSQSGTVILATQSAELTDPAPNGGIYFTSNSFFVGLD